jgi:hypothetical protein
MSFVKLLSNKALASNLDVLSGWIADMVSPLQLLRAFTATRLDQGEHAPRHPQV